jgi:hypothetical protein
MTAGPIVRSRQSQKNLPMQPTRLFLVAATFAGTAALLTAGPSPQYWNRPPTPTQTPPAAATKVTTPAPVAVATCATCACCQKAP